MLRGFPASPARVFPCSPHVRASTCSEAFGPSLPRSCVCWSLLLWSCSSFPADFMELSCSFTNLFWTLRSRMEQLHPSLLLLAHTLAPLRACAGRSKHVQRRARSLLANIPIARPCERSCAPPSPVRRRRVRAKPAFFLNGVPTCFCRRRRSTATSSGTSFCRGVLIARVSYPLRLLTWPSASRARGTDCLSPLRCLVCVAVPTLCPPRPGYFPSPRRCRIRCQIRR